MFNWTMLGDNLVRVSDGLFILLRTFDVHDVKQILYNNDVHQGNKSSHIAHHFAMEVPEHSSLLGDDHVLYSS